MDASMKKQHWVRLNEKLQDLVDEEGEDQAWIEFDEEGCRVQKVGLCL